jgi:hypothetical protein
MLPNHGIGVWYSRTHLRGAQEWQQEIGLALRRCDWFVVILSPRSVKSMWVKRELSYALNQRRFENRIIPYFAGNAITKSFIGHLPRFKWLT